MNSDKKYAIVIPCYREKAHIVNVINDCLEQSPFKIYVIDDCCPDGTGTYVNEVFKSETVEVIFHENNKGVGGALLTGYKKCMDENIDVIVKIDGDGQMDASMIMEFVLPIFYRRADYTKGNRFYNFEILKKMPLVRLFGNTILSFINKMVSGYWNIMDPTNGYTAISTKVLKQIPLEKISQDYFFESDMIFRLGIIRAKIKDIAIPTKYEDETSSLSITKVIFTFPPRYIKNFFKRIIYNYLIRDFNYGSLMLLLGPVLLILGISHGAYHWIKSIETGITASTGTVMISALTVLMGFQSILFFFQHDMNSIPKESIRNI